MQLQNKHIRMMVKIFSLAIENQIPQLKQKQEFEKYNVWQKFILYLYQALKGAFQHFKYFEINEVIVHFLP